ncbi:MAG TPA: type I glutamate--ammonia ligase [Ktedonobacterales bacterium]|jgi:glutamine synthetase|nr:type I glutamate--ammonia ligase [Ktedonobacterales bacterium]
MERQQSGRQPSPTGVGRPEDEARLVEHVETRGVRFVNLEFTDVVGLAKAVTIPAEQLGDALAEGKWFDGSSIEGLARVAETDMYLRPDLATYVEVPWRTEADGAASGDREDEGEGRVARLICDVLMPTGERFGGDPRAALVAALEEAAALGYRFEVAPELEFFLLCEREGRAGEPLPHDRGGYFDLSTDQAADVRREMVAELGRMGIGVEASHHEVAAGQHELDLAAADALRMADALVTARYAIKAIAQRHGLWATFLPKPFFGINGSGMHTHQALARMSDGGNAFADARDGEYGLSAMGRHFVAGQLAHARGMSAVVGQLVNSYKRLVPGHEAPVMISWGRVNREALVRVPRVAGPAGASGRTTVELRSPDPSCNPYLAFAVMLRAGLDGMARELALAAPVEEGLYTLDEQSRLRRGIGLLPATLGEALAALQEDEVVLEALGQQIAAWFVEAKTAEWQEYSRQVTSWELERYLRMF